MTTDAQEEFVPSGTVIPGPSSKRRPNSGADPGPVPSGRSAWVREHCDRVGNGPYDLEYWIQVAGYNDLDPRIIVDR